MNFIISFLSDLIKRLVAPTPQFFKIISTALAIVGVLTGLPAFLLSVGIELGEPFNSIASKVISVLSWIGALLMQLTVTGEAKAKLDLKIKD